MKKITNHPEQLAQKTIQSMYMRNDNMRWLILSITPMSDVNYDLPDKLYNILKEIIDDPEAVIYKFCGDELVIQSRNLCQKTVQRLSAEITNILSPYHLSFKTVLYDLKHHYKNIDSFIDKSLLHSEIIKAKLIAENEQEILKNKELKLRHEFMALEIPETLRDNIANKKNKRCKLSILVIDDDRFSNQLINSALGKDYNIISANSALEGFKLYAQHAPDILLLDIQMPNISGHDFLKKIFALDQNAYVVMLSGNSDSANVQKSIDLGAKGFICKPFSKSKIMEYMSYVPQKNCDITWDSSL